MLKTFDLRACVNEKGQEEVSFVLGNSGIRYCPFADLDRRRRSRAWWVDLLSSVIVAGRLVAVQCATEIWSRLVYGQFDERRFQAASFC